MVRTKVFSLGYIRSFLLDDEKRLIYFLSLIVGLLSALAAVALKNAIYFMHKLLSGGMGTGNDYIFLIYPLIGIAITALFVRYVVRDEIGHGVSRILAAISTSSSRIKRHNSWSSLVASTITIGFGGSVGAEAPIVLTGASIGSNVGRYFNLNYRQITLLLGCGAAGAVAGIFKAPIAGIVFTLEILMLNLTLSSIVPLLIASVTAATVAHFLMGDEVLFNFAVLETFNLTNIPWYIVLGGFTGLVSLYFTRATIFIESLYSRISGTASKIFTGGAILGVLILFFPPLYGEGYDTIMGLLNGNLDEVISDGFFSGIGGNIVFLLLFMLALITFKVVATSSTNGAGGVGGIFAPSLFVGGVSGFFVSRFINSFFTEISVPESSFVLAGMAGTMAGIMHAPLTAIFLIAEITGGYGLLIPLIFTSTISYITIRGFEKYSVYHKQLAYAGELITHDRDRAVLTLMDWTSEIERDLETVSPEATLGELVKAISRSKRNMFPVVDEHNILEGVVLLDDVRDIMFESDKYNTVIISSIMTIPPSYVDIREKMDSVIEIFRATGAWNLPVLDEGRYVGFISKSRIFSAYRDTMLEVSEE